MLNGKTSLPLKFFCVCSYFQVIYKYPRNHLQSQNQINLFCFTYITCKMCPSLCMKYIWSVYNRGELWNSLFMSTLIFHLKRNKYPYYKQSAAKVYFLSEGFKRTWATAVVSLSTLHSQLRPNFFKVNTRNRQKWTQIFKFSLGLCEPYIWLKYHENSH